MGGIRASSHAGLWCGRVGTVALPITTSAEILLILLWQGVSAVWYLNQLLQDTNVHILRKLFPLKLKQVSPITFEPLATSKKLNTWDIFLTVQRIIVRHLIMKGRERISSRGGLLVVCVPQQYASHLTVLYEWCLDSQVFCPSPGSSLLAVTMPVVVPTKNMGTASLNYPCSVWDFMLQKFLYWEALWEKVLETVLEDWF